jgi:hypothetical protein
VARAERGSLKHNANSAGKLTTFLSNCMELRSFHLRSCLAISRQPMQPEVFIAFVMYLFLPLFVRMKPTNKERIFVTIYIDGPPLWSSGQSSWLRIQRSQFRFKALPDFLRSSESGTGFTQPREYNCHLCGLVVRVPG